MRTTLFSCLGLCTDGQIESILVLVTNQSPHGALRILKHSIKPNLRPTNCGQSNMQGCSAPKDTFVLTGRSWLCGRSGFPPPGAPMGQNVHLRECCGHPALHAGLLNWQCAL